jgi:RimJ/RimL family protein N-acetyltransferase
MPVPPPTARLAFREMTPRDLDDMAGLLGDPEVMRHYPHPKSREAASAASACRDHARDVLKADRLIAIIDPHNQPSRRVAEKLGMVVDRTSDNHGRWSSPRRIYAMSL